MIKKHDLSILEYCTRKFRFKRYYLLYYSVFEDSVHVDKATELQGKTS